MALQGTETAIKRSNTKLLILTQDIMELVTLCLNSTYFQYNGKHYKQLHGTAIGSPVSVIVVEIVMQAFEERDIATYQQTPICLRYVDDTFTMDRAPRRDQHLSRTSQRTEPGLTYSLPKRLQKMESFLF